MSVNSYNPISVPLLVSDPDVPNCADGIDQENLESETQESLIIRLQNAIQNEEKLEELEVKKRHRDYHDRQVKDNRKTGIIEIQRFC